MVTWLHVALVIITFLLKHSFNLHTFSDLTFLIAVIDESIEDISGSRWPFPSLRNEEMPFEIRRKGILCQTKPGFSL